MGSFALGAASMGLLMVVLLWVAGKRLSKPAVGVPPVKGGASAAGAILDASAIEGMLEACQSWHDVEVDRTIWLSEDSHLMVAYHDCLSGVTEAVEEWDYEPTADTALGGWVASVAVLSIWSEYRASVMRVLSRSGADGMVAVLDVMIAAATQKFLYDAAVAVGVVGVVDPMVRITPLMDMLLDLEDDDG